MSKDQFHALPIESILKHFNVSLKDGLNDSQVTENFKIYGPNGK